jgi:AcrR family transcriptional regulator
MTGNDFPGAAPMAGAHQARSGPSTRRRGAVLERAILDAAWDELTDAGYAQVTMAGIAARAGTNKAALYRRWPNRTELLAAAIARRIVPLAASPVSTGSLRGDVIAILGAMNDRCRAATIVPDPGGELAAYLLRRAAAAGFEEMGLALSRAGQRGEIDAASVSTQFARIPVNVLHSELCLGTTPVTDQLITEITETALALVKGAGRR